MNYYYDPMTGVIAIVPPLNFAPLRWTTSSASPFVYRNTNH